MRGGTPTPCLSSRHSPCNASPISRCNITCRLLLRCLAPLAAELVTLKVDVIVAYTTAAAAAANEATKDTPIVAYAADPIGAGLISSFARPGGNITGVSLAMSETGAKNLELIRELLPSAGRVAVLLNAPEPGLISTFTNLAPAWIWARNGL